MSRAHIGDTDLVGRPSRCSLALRLRLLRFDVANLTSRAVVPAAAGTLEPLDLIELAHVVAASVADQSHYSAAE